MQETESRIDLLRRRITPLYIYWFKDLLTQIASSQNIHDAIISAFAYLSLVIAFPFFPPEVYIFLLAMVFIAAYMHPLLGLLALLLMTLPLLIYQAPLLAWFLMILISISFLLGYKHYRMITYAYMLAALPLSYLGYLLEIPALILSVLVLGFKRSVMVVTVVALIVIVFSNLANLPVSGPFAYNSVRGHAALMNDTEVAQYFMVSKPAATLDNLFGLWASAVATFFSYPVIGHLTDTFYYAGVAIAYNIKLTLPQIFVWFFVAFSVSNYAVKTRSPYKGAIASIFGVFLLISSYIFSGLSGLSFNYITLLSFLITPIGIFGLEASNIDVVLALDVMKKDILGKFGVAFEDLTRGSNETLDDVANYTQTKQELREALLAPIEHRELAGAYKVHPAKGILLFGPPGTGKTLIMRALANELHAGFFYVKTSSIVSPYPGESAQALSKVFATAKKHAPCVLFFDEIDGIAGRRDSQESSTGREVITELLGQMDGFQKLSDVVIVGATNVPQVLDPSIMRPGRFDKILYMPLPDQTGRAAILKHYLKSLPIANNIDYDKLATLTIRFSAADIKNLCEEVSRQVGEQAITKHEMLMIKMSDIISVLKTIKPSTSLAQLEEYNTFRMDYERRVNPETEIEREKKAGIDDVIGLDEAKKALREAVEIPILHPELMKKYDIGNIKGILLFGPPGTGKTMLIQAVANELNYVHVLTISGYDIAKYGPEKASITVKEIFDRAKENTPAIVFIDEIDALIPSRDEVGEAGVQLTGEFLQEFDKIKQTTGIIVVAATNRPDALDPAMLRAGRFDRLIFTPPPDKENRAKMFEFNLKKAPCGSDVDFSKLAEITEGFTGADIANICRQAKLNALELSLVSQKEMQLTMKDIVALLQKAKPSASSIVLGRYLAFFSKYGKR